MSETIEEVELSDYKRRQGNPGSNLVVWGGGGMMIVSKPSVGCGEVNSLVWHHKADFVVSGLTN